MSKRDIRLSLAFSKPGPAQNPKHAKRQSIPTARTQVICTSNKRYPELAMTRRAFAEQADFVSDHSDKYTCENLQSEENAKDQIFSGTLSGDLFSDGHVFCNVHQLKTGPPKVLSGSCHIGQECRVCNSGPRDPTIVKMSLPCGCFVCPSCIAKSVGRV